MVLRPEEGMVLSPEEMKEGLHGTETRGGFATG